MRKRPGKQANVTIIDRYSCEEVFRRFDDYLDRELTAGELELVEKHLAICATCAREIAFEASLLTQLRAKLKRVNAPPLLLSRVALALSEADRGTRPG